MNKRYTLSAATACIVGIFYFLVHQKMLIVAFHKPTYHVAATDKEATKKQSILYFYKQEQWQQERVELVWPHDTAQALHYSANRWFATAHEEGIIQKKISVAHTCITHDGKGYISCDQSPFEAHQSTREKFFIIQGLLKSIKATGLAVSGIYFLCNNKPLTDTHLDFSTAWSLEPYCS